MMMRSYSATTQLHDIYPSSMTTQEFILRAGRIDTEGVDVHGETRTEHTGMPSIPTPSRGALTNHTVLKAPVKMNKLGVSRRRRISIVDMHKDMIEQYSSLYLMQLRIEQMVFFTGM